MSSYPIHHIDSFTHVLFGGNPTVTVLNADPLTDEEMQKIAREMNLSETGFVLLSQKADLRLRFFTPTNEVKFCGHATVGALCALAKEGLAKPYTKLTIETHVGILNVEIDCSSPHSPRYIFDSPSVDLVPAPYSIEEMAHAMQIPLSLFDLTKPLMLDKTHQYLYFAVKDLESLKQFNPDMRQTTEFAKRDGIVVFCALTNQTFDSRNHLHARGFAPLVGVPEDPFTGSMQGALAAYARQYGMIDPAIKWIGTEQGHFIGRPGCVQMEIVNSSPFHIRLHAEAVHVYASTLNLRTTQR
jgi:PhzF family phenazine biosynthesis protein